MPAAPKSPKKSGAPKGKGAVRAKSGCYTCRIRRKKCDEKANHDGHCETCVRLRLECLGFGTKRPEWLRDNRNVLAVRDRIKSHLAAQGMIKGHSGAGPRNAEREPPVLRLHDEYPSGSSSASPPTPTLSISSSDDNRRSGLHISSMRDDGHYPLQPEMQPYHSGLTPRIQELSPNDPQPSRGPMYSHDIMLPAYHNIPTTNNSLDSPPAWQSTTSYEPKDFPSPALYSSFSPLYTQELNDIDDLTSMGLVSIMNAPHEFGQLQVLRNVPNSTTFAHIPYESMELVQHYLQNVVDIQYLLADKMSTTDLMLNTMQSSVTALDAACLLSKLHKLAMNRGVAMSDQDSDEHFNRVHSSLICKGNLDEGDAMAGLHVVSFALFSGGRGRWQDFLNVACRYSSDILYSPRTHGFQDALLRANMTTQFIIKTSMWFDVLASATRVTRPYFLEVFRHLFSPEAAHIEGGLESVLEALDMLPIMGAENHIVWALAEISDLAVWKELQKERGALSMPELIKRGAKIEQYLLPPQNARATYTELDQMRLLTSEVFRASARVYLHSVLSGDYPSCKEIQEGVQDTIDCLKRVPEQGSRSVVRSVVFSICICGSLTDDLYQRAFLLGRLQSQQRESVGNCAQVESLMQEIWHSRDTSGTYTSKTWRDVMRESEMLLV